MYEIGFGFDDAINLVQNCLFGMFRRRLALTLRIVMQSITNSILEWVKMKPVVG